MAHWNEHGGSRVGGRELPRPFRTGMEMVRMYQTLARVVRSTATECWQKFGEHDYQVGAVYTIPTAAGAVFLAEGHDFEQSKIVDNQYKPIILKMSTVEQEALDTVKEHAQKGNL